jgi:photosystem II stability/assembly factor-like uncharacterized protein
MSKYLTLFPLFKAQSVRFRFAAVLALASLAAPLHAADADWQPLTTELLKAQKPGFGGLCGVVVDHHTGDITINVSDRGFFRSTDGGKTWQKCGDKQPRGRTESPGCFLLDPTAKSHKMLSALVYGSPVSVSADRGATWQAMDNKTAHVDWCAVDWTDPEMKFVLALKHEAGGLLLLSRDAGKTFTEVGKGFGPGWIFDNQIAVVAGAPTKDRPRPSLLRTTDAGKTWRPCGQYSPVGVNSAQALPKWRDGCLYWLVDGALIATTDKGESWEKRGEVKDGRYGPIFGKGAGQMFVLTAAGIVESSDGGATWSRPLPPPKDLKGIAGLTWIEYDPKEDVLYLMKMGSDLFRLRRR